MSVQTDHAAGPSSPGCGARPDPKGGHVRDLGLAREEEIVLAVARLFFLSFAAPGSEAWIAAMAAAAQGLGPRDGAIVAARLLDVIQAIRRSRRSVFLFNATRCPDCSALATEHERRLLRALCAVRRGEGTVARAEIMMLCEGNPAEAVLGALSALGRALDAGAARAPDPVPCHHQARGQTPASSLRKPLP